MTILLTGCAGFIGSHVLERLLADGHDVVGVDNFDPFYDRTSKEQNLAPSLRGNGVANLAKDSTASDESVASQDNPSAISNSTSPPRFVFVEGDLADAPTCERIGEALCGRRCGAVIHLAAKAGVRPSIEDPVGYQRANVIATQHLLEFARRREIPQFVFASSSSVYGVNPNVPWREDDHVLQPISPYASTKVSCELLGHVYSRLFGIRFLALRFFTVYGPRQRPDLAIHKFARRIGEGQNIPVFGDGSTRRDYTYIDDVVGGILGALRYQGSDYEVINLGNDRTVTLAEMIATIEQAVGKKAVIDRQPEQPGDVPQTWADIGKARELLGYAPETSFEEGVRKFVEWLRERQENR